MNTWGENIKLSIFGESHGKAIGVCIDGLPAGLALDMDLIAGEMARRAPGQDVFATARREADEVDIISGFFEGKTTGSPLCGLIYNKDARSRDYDRILRPGHADWTALLKYGGYADMRGGGHFSGRLTAPLVFAGAIAKQVLAGYGVEVFARIVSIGAVSDTNPPENPGEWKNLSSQRFAAMEPVATDMRNAISEAKVSGDSVGGVIEAVVFGAAGGLGEPFFGSVESRIASMMFSIPAVKGVEFGRGFALAGMRGSEANDEIYVERKACLGGIYDGNSIDDEICAEERAYAEGIAYDMNGTDGEVRVEEQEDFAPGLLLRSRTNNNGGILGGISNGMPILTRVAIKPTASIAREQMSVDLEGFENRRIQVRGRHDPCIVPRAVPVVEAGVALCMLDLSL